MSSSQIHDHTVTLRVAEDVAELTLKTLQSGIDSAGKDEPVFSGKIIKSRWAMIERIGSGGFGSIFKAFDTEKHTEVAIKVEKRQGKCYLDKEVLFYATLENYTRPDMVRAAPRCHYSGVEGGYKIAVFDLMGESLSDLFYRCGRRFSLKTVLMLAQQLVSRLESVHEAGIVHRDVKPGNFVMGRGEDSGNVYVIDFGLSNLWRCAGRHIAFNTESPFRGTHRYASVNSHMKYEQSRRDDLEAIAYVLIYFLKGGLPWQSLKVPRSKRRKAIGRFKASFTPDILCAGLPSQFAEFLLYVKGLGFEDTPNYQYCRDLFRICFERHQFEDDGIWDWDLLPPSPARSPNILQPPAFPLMHDNMAASYGHPNINASGIAATKAAPPSRMGASAAHNGSNARHTSSSHRSSAALLATMGNTAAHHSGPSVNLASSMAPLALASSSRPSIHLLPKAKINIVDSGFDMDGSTRATGQRNNGGSSALDFYTPSQHHYGGQMNTAIDGNVIGSASVNQGPLRTSTGFIRLNGSSVMPGVSKGVGSSSNAVSLTNSMATSDGSDLNSMWCPSSQTTYSSSPMLGSSEFQSAAAMSTASAAAAAHQVRLSSSSPILFHHQSSQPASGTSSPMYQPGSSFLIDLDDDGTMPSFATASSSFSHSTLTSSTSTTVTPVTPPQSTPMHSPCSSAHIAASLSAHHQSHQHTSYQHQNHQQQQLHQLHPISTPGSPSSSTRSASPVHGASSHTASDALWNSSPAPLPLDVLAETSYVSNGTSTTDCLSGEAMLPQLNSNQASSNATLSSELTLPTRLATTPNPKKRARPSHGIAAETAVKRRSVRLRASRERSSSE